jgi:beta-lactamase class A
VIKNRLLLVSGFLLIFLAVGFVAYRLANTSEVAPQDVAQVLTDSSTEEETQAPFDAEALNQALQQWYGTQSGRVSVVVATTSGEVLASINPDEPFFAASIYKLYVAYAGYLRIDNGIFKTDQIYLGSNTTQQCLDAMIRSSDSPCAEKMWTEIGKEALTSELDSLGLSNTDMVGLSTTAYDAAIMLSRIASAQQIKESSKEKLLASMRDQIYNTTLDAGFTGATVYNKVGFRDYDEYHDVAIVEFEDGRAIIVAVFTDGIGTAAIRDLGTRLAQAVNS